MASHAVLSPSAAERWLSCPGSVSWADGVSDDPSEFAAEGTVAHAIRAECLALGLDPHDSVGHTIKSDGFSFEVTDEMADYLLDGIDQIRGDVGPDGNIWVEHRTDLRRWIPEGFGTLDVGIILPKLIVIDDLKYGAGVAVSPIENKQLMIYALGFWDNIARHQSDATEFMLRIDQPRIGEGGGEWRVSLEELLRFGEEVLKPGALRTVGPDAPFRATAKGCRWCKRRQECDTLAAFNLDLVGAQFEDLTGSSLTLTDIHTLTPERRSHILLHKSTITGWLETLHTAALSDALAGKPVPKMKAVLGRRPGRKWKDEEKAGKTLTRKIGEDKTFVTEVISPAVAQKLMGKKSFEADKELKKLVTQGEAKPVLVDENAKGDPIRSHAQKFADADEEELLGGSET